MSITFLPTELDQPSCGVTAGLMTELSDMGPIAESFRGLVDLRPVADSDSTDDCDVIFRRSGNHLVETFLPADNGVLPHRMTISVSESPYPAAESVVHAVLAPAFAPGSVGVDWADVCLILRSGQEAILVMAESDKAVAEALRLVEDALAAVGRNRISGVVAAAFVRRGENWLEMVTQLSCGIDSLVPDAVRLTAAPVVIGHHPICSVLAVLSE